MKISKGKVKLKTNLLAEGILLGSDRDVVVVEGLLELGSRDTDLLGKSLTVLEALHEATTNVVLAMPFDFLGGLTVEHKSDRELENIKSARAEIISRPFQ